MKSTTDEMCNKVLAHLCTYENPRIYSVKELTRSTKLNSKDVRKCIAKIKALQPGWITVYKVLFRVKAIEFSTKRINEVRYYLAQGGFKELAKPLMKG